MNGLAWISLQQVVEAFYREWRLVALEGTQFSLINTPANNAARRKAKSRRGRAAFAKLTTGVLVEVGLHNPLAAAIGQDGESEWRLALGLLARLRAQALLLADRLHGCAAFASEACRACQRVGSHFLIRARTQIKVRGLKRFRDGSRLVRLPVREKGRRDLSHELELREIRVRVGRPGHRSQTLRLWTTRLDPRQAPAAELIPLDAPRWEHELYDRHRKHERRKTDLLQRHTVHTAAQEIAALRLASALLARERVRVAQSHARQEAPQPFARRLPVRLRAIPELQPPVQVLHQARLSETRQEGSGVTFVGITSHATIVTRGVGQPRG